MAHASSQYHLQQQQQQHSSFRGSVSIDAARSDKGSSPHPYYDQGQLLSPEQQQRQAMWIGSNMSGGLPSGSLDQERQQFRDRSSRHFEEYAHVHPATSEVGATPLFSTGAVTSGPGHHSPTYIASGVMESRHGYPTAGGRTRGQTRHSLLLETNPYSAQGPGVEAHMSYPPASGASMMEGLPMVPPNHTPLPGTPDAHLSPGNFLTPSGMPSVGSHSYPSHHQHGHYPPHQYFQLQRSMTVPSPGSMGMEGLPQEAMPEHTLNPSSSSSTSSPPPPQFPTLPSIPHQNSVWNNRPAPSRTSSAPYRISRSASDMAKNLGASGHAQTASFSSSSSSTAPRGRTRTSSVTSSSSSASFGIVSSLSAAFGSTHLSYSDTSSPTTMSMGHGQYPRRNDYMMSPHSPLVGSGSFSMRDPRFSGGSPGDLSMSDDDPNSAARKTLAARNFTCSFPGCNKAYTQLHNLKSHERTGHTPVTKLKPFMCIISGCTKAFSQRKSLAHHIKISHQEFKFKPFKCGQPDCPKAYTQLHNLRTHEKTVHQLDLSKKRIRLPEGPRDPGSFGKAMTLEQQHQQHQHQHQGGGQGFDLPPTWQRSI
ncbi:hypothetical protein BG000_007582 [Podila horticola]|nr:hypothetical protein BG000_007582 [Podila horticola]